MVRGGERVVYAEACSEIEALVIPRDRFHAYLESDNSVAMLVVDMLSCRLRGLTEAVLNLTADDVNTRVVKLLLRLSQLYGAPMANGSRQLDIPLIHQTWPCATRAFFRASSRWLPWKAGSTRNRHGARRMS